MDNQGGESDMLAAMPSSEDATQAHIFAIGFGSSADLTTLALIANATNGDYWAASTSNLQSVYLQISYEL